MEPGLLILAGLLPPRLTRRGNGAPCWKGELLPPERPLQWTPADPKEGGGVCTDHQVWKRRRPRSGRTACLYFDGWSPAMATEGGGWRWISGLMSAAGDGGGPDSSALRSGEGMCEMKSELP